jgi:nucleotide-binding universal stress UspA family protein
LLFATDLSSWAEGARRVVSHLATLTNGKVCIVHVAAKEPAMEEGQRKLNLLMRGLRRQGIEAESVYLSGEPIEAILGQAARWEADMIAVGTQGRRGLPRLLLGSVAEGVLRRAGCPVLVVKNAELPAGMKDRRRRKQRS